MAKCEDRKPKPGRAETKSFGVGCDIAWRLRETGRKNLDRPLGVFSIRPPVAVATRVKL
jgi:hypothetical protein